MRQGESANKLHVKAANSLHLVGLAISHNRQSVLALKHFIYDALPARKTNTMGAWQVKLLC